MYMFSGFLDCIYRLIRLRELRGSEGKRSVVSGNGGMDGDSRFRVYLEVHG